MQGTASCYREACLFTAASGKLHVEQWAGRDGSLSLPISQAVEIVTVCRLPPPFFASLSPGPGWEVRNGIGWTSLEKTARSGMWWLRGALGGESLFFALSASSDCIKKGSFLTAWAFPPLSS